MTTQERATAPASSIMEMRHATAVEIAGRAVLLTGRSGAGKSDLAIRLIDRGARLISDDYTELTRVGEVVLARPPALIAGKIEVRGIGVIEVPYVEAIPVALLVTLDEVVERMPTKARTICIAGINIPVLALEPFHASTAIKIQIALTRPEGATND